MQTKILLLPALALSTVAAMGQKKSEAAKSGKTNVVFFMCDQMSAMALPLYGNNFVKTPNMDRMAKEGITFMNSICVVPFSSPSRASFITGLYPNTHGIISNVERSTPGIDPKFPSTELILNADGYATGHFGKWHLGDPQDYPCYKSERDGMKGGYADERAKLGAKPEPARKGEVLSNPKYDQGFGLYQTEYMYDKNVNGPAEYKKELSTIGRIGTPVDWNSYTMVVRDGIDFIKANKDKPFMATISISPPHAPFVAPNPYYDMVDPAKVPLSPTAYDTDPKTNYYTNSRVFKMGQYMGEEGTRERMRSYYALVMYVDDMLGRVLDAIKESGLEKNTVVVFTSDHGDPLASHGMLYGKTIDGFVEELTLTPTIIRLPGGAHGGKKVQAHFNTVDLAPTLLDYVGKPVPASMQGRSFKNIIEGKEKDNIGFGYSMRLFARLLRGEVNGKIYAYSKTFSGFNANKVREELYDVTSDPYQQKDLAADAKYASVMATMRSEFDKFADKYGDWHIGDMPAKGPYNLGNFDKPAKSGVPAKKTPAKSGAAKQAPAAKKAKAAN